MTGKELLDKGTAKLVEKGIENARREAMFLLASLVDCEPTSCYVIDRLPECIEREFNEKLDRRLKDEPLQIILGKWEFYGRPILLEKGVFVPRPETEGMIDVILERLPQSPDIRGLEIGVGSGAIGVNLLAERSKLKITGTDISPVAISLSRKNALNLGVEDRFKLFQTDISTDIDGPFDFVVSNPPYITFSEMENLPEEVKHDPGEALQGGTDGMEVIRKIIQSSIDKLNSGGFIALEIHEDKGDEVLKLLSMEFEKNKIICDINCKDRYAIGYRET